MNRFKKSFQSYMVLLCLVLCSSCQTHNLFDPQTKEAAREAAHLKIADAPLHRLKTDDKINISIWNHDDMSIGSLFGIYNSNEVYNKWVLIDQKGYATFPKIGEIYLKDMTIEEATLKVKDAYAKFIKDPIIVLKLLNKKVTILGQVLAPGSYVIEKESGTLFEMLGMSGMFDTYANLKKVKFIRENKAYILDLTNMEEYERNNITLQDGDIIYIPVRKGKMLDTKMPLLVPLSSFATTLLIVVSFFGN